MYKTTLPRSPLVTPILAALAAITVLPAPSVSAASEQPPFTAFSSGGGQVIVSREGEDYLGFNVIAWGPKWSWTGLHGEARSEQGAAVGTLTAKMGGTGVPFRVGFRVEHPAPRQLQFQYELQAEADTDTTLVVVELTPGKTFHGRDVLVRTEGQQASVRCPFERRGLGNQVDAVRMTDARGGATLMRFDSPCEIGSDGPARIVLAKDRLRGGTPQRLTITVDLPQETQWYPSLAEMPDEPGIETWYQWQATGDAADSVLGMQDWIERPAGKHGRIVRREDKLIYNGRPIKLWGLNLCYGTCAPEKDLADKLNGRGLF